MDRIPSPLPPLPPPARALLLGFVTGLRSQVPVALLAIESQQGRFDPGAGRLARRFSSSEGVAGSLVAFAGELVADKLPITPRRTTSGPFLQRLATGATIGPSTTTPAGRAPGRGRGRRGGAGAWAGTRARAFVPSAPASPPPDRRARGPPGRRPGLRRGHAGRDAR